MVDNVAFTFYLLENFVFSDLEARDNEGSTPLHLASAFGDDLASRDNDCDMVSLLLAHKANITLRDCEGIIPLHTAAAFGKTGMVRRFTLRGSDVNAVDSNEDTPLHVSAGSGHLNVVRLLVDNGADLFAVDKEGLTAAACAEKSGHNQTKQFHEESRYRCS